jgi:predicted GIY-YIG superfamily endonuclease
MKRELEIKTYSRKEKIQLVRTFNEEELIE